MTLSRADGPTNAFSINTDIYMYSAVMIKIMHDVPMIRDPHKTDIGMR